MVKMMLIMLEAMMFMIINVVTCDMAEVLVLVTIERPLMVLLHMAVATCHQNFFLEVIAIMDLVKAVISFNIKRSSFFDCLVMMMIMLEVCPSMMVILIVIVVGIISATILDMQINIISTPVQLVSQNGSLIALREYDASSFYELNGAISLESIVEVVVEAVVNVKNVVQVDLSSWKH